MEKIVDEEKIHHLRPLNMYGYSKQLFDLWARRTGLLKNITGLKYFNVFGPNEYHKADMRSFVLKAFEQIIADGKVKLFKSHKPDYKDGQQLRDFIYVKDVAAITCDLLDTPPSGIVNVGKGVATSWNALARAVFKALSLEESIEYIKMPEDLEGKYQYFTKAQTEKLERLLKPSVYSIDSAVDDYINQHLLAEKRW